jgi:hypothetical protein
MCWRMKHGCWMQGWLHYRQSKPHMMSLKSYLVIRHVHSVTVMMS